MCEIKRVFWNRKMVIGILLGFAMLSLGGWEEVGCAETDFLEAYLMANAESPTAYISLFFPLIAVLPYAGGYREERGSGMYCWMMSRISVKRYLIGKLGLAFLSGMVVVGIPHILWYSCCMIGAGTEMSEHKNCIITFAMELYDSNPVLYGWMIVGNAALCGGMMAVLGAGICAWIRNKYIGMLIPFLYYLFSAAVLGQINENLNAVFIYYLNGKSYFEAFPIILYAALLLLLGSAGMILRVRLDLKTGIGE